MLSILAFVLLLGSSSAQSWNAELVTNGGFDDWNWYWGHLVYWSSTDGSPNVYGYPGSGTLPASVPNRGCCYAYGGSSAASSITQWIDVSAFGAYIDTFTAQFIFSAYLGGYGTQTDYAYVTAAFYDASQTFNYGAATVGPVSMGMRGGTTELDYTVNTGLVPFGTRYVQIKVWFIREVGSTNDGYADSISFQLNQVPHVDLWKQAADPLTVTTYAGYRYRYFPQSVNWPAAKQICETSTYHGTIGWLAHVDSSADSATIFNLIYANSEPTGVWVGGSNAANTIYWRWMSGPLRLVAGGYGKVFFQGQNYVTGTCQSYCAWSAVSPSGASGYNYMLMAGVSNPWGVAPGQWLDQPAQATAPYVCQYVDTKAPAQTVCDQQTTRCNTITAGCSNMGSTCTSGSCTDTKSACTAVRDACNTVLAECNRVLSGLPEY